MLVPRFVCGLTRDVKKESLRRLRLMKKGATWNEAMSDDLVDLNTLPGWITLSPSITTVYKPYVHIHAPFHWAWTTILKETGGNSPEANRRYRDEKSKVFFDAITTPWGVLGMIGDSTWVTTEAHQWPYVLAVERWWDEFEAVGDRYDWASGLTQPLWRMMDAPAKALFALGFPVDEYLALKPQGFHALYRRLLEVRAAQGLPPPPELGA